MELEYLSLLVSRFLSTREIAAVSGKSQTTVRYWLKAHDLKTLPKSKRVFQCPDCGTRNLEAFYKKGRRCRKCFNKRVMARQKATVQRAIEYLGGTCIKCGYNRCVAALEIHHQFPDEKEPTFRSFRGWSWPRLEKGLKNCVLLCANCHQEEHKSLFVGQGYKSAASQRLGELRRKNRETFIEERGGSCLICNYVSSLWALDFHHVVPEHKDDDWNSRTWIRKLEKIRPEIEKCVLVCRNCHREIHAGLINFEAMVDYSDGQWRLRSADSCV